MFTATVIAGGALQAADISDAVQQMDLPCSVGGWRWVEDGVAADIMFGEDPAWAHGVLGGHFPRHDLIIQPAATREKRLLIADMDSTMITVECIDELADYAGIKPEIAAITESAMRGELDFAGALDARVALLAGLDEGAIERCLAERVTLMPGARTLVRTMKARGAHTILVSGGFTRFAEPVADMIGFDRAIANRLLVEDGRLTGRVAKPIVGADTKLATLEAAMTERSIPRSATLAVGDGANDLPMIRAAGLGVAYHAKPVVAEAAAARIEHGDLTTLLYAQGIARKDWVE
ncbi:MAG TPA: phosphoserine phosphatase SerB [Sphingomonas sp.]